MKESRSSLKLTKGHKMTESWQVDILDEAKEDFVLPPEPKIISEQGVHRIVDFDNLDKPYLKPKNEQYHMSENDKYTTACYLTSNLYCRHFLKNLKNNEFKIVYYDSPFQEFHVQSLFMECTKCIDIIDVDLNLDFMIHISENKNMFNSLTKIIIRRCNVDENMLAVLCPELDNAYNLVLLDLSQNPLTDNGFKEIMLYLYDWTSLRSLILINTQLSNKSLEMLGSIYSERRIYLNKIDLSQNLLNKPLSVKRFLGALGKQNPPLQELILRQCCLQGSDTAEYFGQYLKSTMMLKSLDLGFNLFQEEEEVISLATLLMESNLKCLNLSYNVLKENSTVELLKCICKYPERESKTLVIEEMTIPQRFPAMDPNFLTRQDINFIHAGIRKLELSPIEDLRIIFLKRFQYLYKKGKPKKNLVVETIKEYIPEKKLKNARVSDFKDALMAIPSRHIDSKLVDELVNVFSASCPRVNVELFITLYEELFPPKKKKIDQTDF